MIKLLENNTVPRLTVLKLVLLETVSNLTSFVIDVKSITVLGSTTKCYLYFIVKLGTGISSLSLVLAFIDKVGNIIELMLFLTYTEDPDSIIVFSANIYSSVKSF